MALGLYLSDGKGRQTLFDSLGEAVRDRNLFCAKADLTGPESRVEAFFLNRLLSALGYRDSEIRTKDRVEELPVPKGRKTVNFRPDYVLVSGDKPRIVIDAKSTDEDVDDWIDQCSGYSLVLNRRYTNDNPVRFFFISNGLMTKVFKWDEETPTLDLAFEDFQEGNPKWMEFRLMLEAKQARKGWRDAPQVTVHGDWLQLRRPEMGEVKKLFLRCHRLIWKTEKKGPISAFFEFSKIMFVKTYEDRRLHLDPDLAPLLAKGKPIPSDKVRFSRRWIESLETTNDNPVDALLFRKLMEELEELVVAGTKKRIFEPNEHINLGPGTLKEVVSRLEKVDLWGIDEELNGRLFETFLSATMRGQALGQYFTPRTIVKFMTRLAEPLCNWNRTDVCIDACCGTGGFLIELLTEMRQKVRDNRSLTDNQRNTLFRRIADESIFGIDAGTDPPIARIARLNMYLHGDGGSRIYATDALDKRVMPPDSATPEEKKNTAELRDLLIGDGMLFDLALTNPPFSMDMTEANAQESVILRQYALSTEGKYGTSKRTSSLRSSIMFLERYHDILKPGGKLITVIDDSVLGGPKFGFARDWIRRNFVVRAVISLSGDAFQRSGARSKTSVLFLVKKTSQSEAQPDIFMAESIALGLDDVPPTSPPSRVEKARQLADEEMETIVNNFGEFSKGNAPQWGVPSSAIANRLDVKFLLRTSPLDKQWKNNGIRTSPLESLVDPVWEPVGPRDSPDQLFPMLRVGYDGLASTSDLRLGREMSYEELMIPKVNDILVSNISAIYGSIGIMPTGLNAFATPEFTVLRMKDDCPLHAIYLWSYLRSPEVRARLLSDATGMGRTRVNWEILKHLPVALLDEKRQKRVVQLYEQYLLALGEASTSESQATDLINSSLMLDNDWARKRLRSAKPPR